MSPSEATVKAPASAAFSPVRPPAKRFSREPQADWLWSACAAAANEARSAKAAATRAARRKRDLDRAAAAAPERERLTAEARVRLEARHAERAAANPRFVASLAGFAEYEAAAGDRDAKLVWQSMCQAAWDDARREKAAEVAAEVESRLRFGFVWSGGVGGNTAYERPGFVCRGLVSEGVPTLQFFASKLRRAQALRVGYDKGEVYAMGSKLLALDAPYVEDNRSMCGVLRIEIDRVLPWADIEAGCREAGVPLPNIAVGWEDADGRVHNPHLLWLLHDSLPLAAAGKSEDGKTATRFLSAYRGVLRGLVNALLHLGADPGGLLNSHKHKNPLSPLWDRRIFVEQPYDLADIAQRVDTKVTLAELQEAAPATSGPLEADHPDAVVAAGSNKVFRRLAAWAREQVVIARAAGGAEEGFAALVAERALSLAAEVGSGDSRKAEPVALRMAESVANWTWNKWTPPAPPKPRLSEAALLELRSAAARKVAAGRRERSASSVVAAALALRADGVRVTQAAVQKRLDPIGIATVKRCWPTILAALAEAASLPATADPAPAQEAAPAPQPAPRARPRQMKPAFMALPLTPPAPVPAPVPAPPHPVFEDPEIPW